MDANRVFARTPLIALWATGLQNEIGSAKYMIAEGDTYQKFPDDETYPYLIVNYVKLDRGPKFDEAWSPILRAMRASSIRSSSERTDGFGGASGRELRQAVKASAEDGMSGWKRSVVRNG